MPIPGDNGNPKAERDAQNERIRNEALTGGFVRKDVVFNKPEPEENTILGVPKK